MVNIPTLCNSFQEIIYILNTHKVWLWILLSLDFLSFSFSIQIAGLWVVFMPPFWTLNYTIDENCKGPWSSFTEIFLHNLGTLKCWPSNILNDFHSHEQLFLLNSLKWVENVNHAQMPGNIRLFPLFFSLCIIKTF